MYYNRTWFRQITLVIVGCTLLLFVVILVPNHRKTIVQTSKSFVSFVRTEVVDAAAGGLTAEPIIDCNPGIPCVYPETVDFRIIVITYNRPVSLMKLLKTLDTVELDGDSARLEIWVDRNRQGGVDNATMEALAGYKWAKGPSRVHIQKRNVGIMGQWIDTWSPRDKSMNSTEIGVIFEDDISVSPHIWRWLKAVHRHYATTPDFVGASLTSDGPMTMVNGHRPVVAPKNHTVLLYKCIGTWGMSATAYHWHRFQEWFHNIGRRNKYFHPYVPGIAPTQWYKEYEGSGHQDGMWEMWLIYYTYKERLFTMYNNLPTYNGDAKSCLSINRREVGLHNSAKGSENHCKLLDLWKDEYIVFPQNVYRIDWNGTNVTHYF